MASVFQKSLTKKTTMIKKSTMIQKNPEPVSSIYKIDKNNILGKGV